ncbi:class I adenylate-forming enzyme family protein [Nonomuraea sp. NPDC050328]|uniref:class I adenylate-forming enzyme family protein n=1 Tax=Nonomuraea sp. NPDC050328 TaxID=3364361 RepID=UPI00378D5449
MGDGVAPPYGSVSELVRAAAVRFGEAEFLRFAEGALSFREVDARSERLAHVLAVQGVSSGDRVAIMMGNTLGWPLSWFAVLKAGAIAVPVNPRLREADLGFVLRDSGACFVLTEEEHLGVVEGVVGRLERAPVVQTLAGLEAAVRRAPETPLVVTPDGGEMGPGAGNWSQAGESPGGASVWPWGEGPEGGAGVGPRGKGAECGVGVWPGSWVNDWPGGWSGSGLATGGRSAGGGSSAGSAAAKGGIAASERALGDGGGIANFQYTSGTTGFPKACMLTHDYWLRTAWLVARQVRVREDDVVLMTQPFSYMDDQWMAVLCLYAGIPLVVLPRFSASGFWPAVREHRATLTYVLGTMPLLMHKQPPSPLDRVNDMRVVLCSGIAPHLHEVFEERWGVPWREIYGSTESGLDLLVAPQEDETVGTGAMGCAPPGKEVRVAGPDGREVAAGAVGEIVVRGLPMMLGYWNQPEATAEVFAGGWYHTGDLGFRDPEGRIHHAGRLTDSVRRGGENISCAEVESVLAQHPAVAAVALVAIPDELFGELPKAFVQVKTGCTVGARELIEYARASLAPFKVPAYLEFVEGFEMTPSERIRKRALLEPERDQRAGAYEAATDTWRGSGAAGSWQEEEGER